MGRRRQVTPDMLPTRVARHFVCGTCGREVWVNSDRMLQVGTSACAVWADPEPPRRTADLANPELLAAGQAHCAGTLYPTPGRVLTAEGEDMQLMAPLGAGRKRK